MKFFSEACAATDHIYATTRSSENEPHPKARAFIEHIYAGSASFLDPDLAQRAPTNGLTPAFFEMYLAYTLDKNGIALVPRLRRIPKLSGPDLLAERPQVWIEAVTATGGVGPDRLLTPELGTAYHVPTEAFVLRLRSAIEYKAAKLRRYIQRGYIKSGHAAVIAVSGALLEFRFSELPIPRIVRALYGVGDIVAEINRATKTARDSVEYCDEITKVGGAPVKTDLFLQPEYAHVSAVIYSPSCWVCHPHIAGSDFIVVHNPHALTQLPSGWLRAGKEYWLDNSVIRTVTHRIPDTDSQATSGSACVRPVTGCRSL